MAFLKKIWKDRQSEHPTRRRLTPVSGKANTYEVERDEGLILEEGEAFNAKNMNDLESRIESGFLESGLCRYAHAKAKTVHQLTGPANAKGISFAAAVDFAAGDTFTLNGAVVTARTLSGEPLWPGYFKKGSVVLCHVNGGVLTFSGGGGLGSADKETVKAFLAVGHSVLGGQVQGSYTADATAGSDQLSEGAVAYAKGQRIVGRVPLAKGGWKENPAWRQSSNVVINDGAVFLNPDGQNYYYSGVSFLGAAVPELTAKNIRKGVRIGSITGSLVEGAQYYGIAAVTQTYDEREMSQGVLSQNIGVFEVASEGVGVLTLRATRQVRFLIMTTGRGNVSGGVSGCTLQNGWNTLSAGQEFSLNAKVGAHGNNHYQTTCCCMVF